MDSVLCTNLFARKLHFWMNVRLFAVAVLVVAVVAVGSFTAAFAVRRRRRNSLYDDEADDADLSALSAGRKQRKLLKETVEEDAYRRAMRLWTPELQSTFDEE
jgi:hypothetical protein